MEGGEATVSRPHFAPFDPISSFFSLAVISLVAEIPRLGLSVWDLALFVPKRSVLAPDGCVGGSQLIFIPKECRLVASGPMACFCKLLHFVCLSFSGRKSGRHLVTVRGPSLDLPKFILRCSWAWEPVCPLENCHFV